MAGGIDPPTTFAWTCAWIGVPLLALGVYSMWALYNVPVLQDDLSDPASGWPVDAGPDWSLGYHEGGYRIELAGPDSQGVFLMWREGALPNVAVEADVNPVTGDQAHSAAGVGCLVSQGIGYVFVIGFNDTFAILRFDEDGLTSLTGGHLPSTVHVMGSTYRIRGECRAGFGGARLTMYIDGTKLKEATEPDEGKYRAFQAIRLVAACRGDDRRSFRQRARHRDRAVLMCGRHNPQADSVRPPHGLRVSRSCPPRRSALGAVPPETRSI